jgi:hypothetical protein
MRLYKEESECAYTKGGNKNDEKRMVYHLRTDVERKKFLQITIEHTISRRKQPAKKQDGDNRHDASAYDLRELFTVASVTSESNQFTECTKERAHEKERHEKGFQIILRNTLFDPLNPPQTKDKKPEQKACQYIKEREHFARSVKHHAGKKYTQCREIAIFLSELFLVNNIQHSPPAPHKHNKQWEIEPRPLFIKEVVKNNAQ